MQAKGWRRCLFAIILAAWLANVSCDLSDDVIEPSADSRSGYYIDKDDVDDYDAAAQSVESNARTDEAEEFAASLAEHGIPGYMDDDRRYYGNVEPVDWIEEIHPNYKLQKPSELLLHGYGSGYKHLDRINGVKINENRLKNSINNPKYVIEHSQLPRHQFPKLTYPQGYKFSQPETNRHADGSLLKHVVPVPVSVDNEYLASQHAPPSYGSSFFKTQKFFSKRIPLDQYIWPSQVPGAENVIKCAREGEIHNFWAPDFYCLVCVCLPEFGRLSPVCVSCQTCLTPPEPVTVQPVTVPPTPPPQPEDVSCKPLPVNVPFPSPIDPCKVCVCFETYDDLGRPDVRIECQHNPQCVLPTTQQPLISTPVPLPVCDKFPPNVPFPHPNDSCKICQCTVTKKPFGQIERKIICYISPDCQPSTSTQTPDITDIPPTDICNRYPDDTLFPHPHDPCQVCKCVIVPERYVLKKKITCYVKPSCIPDNIVTPEPITIAPEQDCAGRPENVPFPHPTNPCLLCKCVRNHNTFKAVTELICFENPSCIITPSTTLAPTPPPQPDDAKCSPLPINTPFQSPINPCQICTCIETADFFGRVSVEINCQDNPQCVLPQNTTTLPPDIVTGIPLPACKNFPENVLFPHPSDACKVCRCYMQRNPLGIPEQHINCYTKTECLPTPSPTPEPELNCVGRPENVPFLHPADPCLLCKCVKNHNIFKIAIELICFENPTCAPTPPPQPDDVKCAPLPINTPFQSPINPCQICTCTETADFFGRVSVEINCQDNPQCVLPQNTTTLPPDIVTGIPLPACKNFPENVLFPHPSDACKVCRCYTQRNPLGVPEQHINCYTKTECLPTPPPTPEPELDCAGRPENIPFPHPTDPCFLCKCVRNHIFKTATKLICFKKPSCISTIRPPITPEPEPTIASCAPLPVGDPFPSPVDPCQTCVCTERVDLFGRHDVVIECQANPACVIPDIIIPDSNDKPMPWPACKNFPPNVPVPRPNDLCQRCKCIVTIDQFGNPVEQISCYTLLGCVQPQTTQHPIPDDLCRQYPINTPFDDPTDHCKTCTCTQIGSIGPGSLGPSAIRNRLFPPQYQIVCQTKPECLLPPTTEYPNHDIICGGYPVNTPFDDPNDHCKTCTCTQIGSVGPGSLGLITIRNPLYPSKYQIVCQTKPECLPTEVPKPDSPKPEPITSRPPQPDVSCKPLPSGVSFQSPLNPCQICICTETEDTYGRPDVKFKCQHNPECVIPNDLTTVLPACAQFPPNVEFPHPIDQCKLCKCTALVSAAGTLDQHITCYTNPDCDEIATTTSAPTPWPPAPGPLPGPAPHESCSPYIHNQPFQHPWDDCQVCICKEAITLERITIEVNCYTKPSCCYEPPVEISGSENVPVEIRNWKFSNENQIGYSGNHLFRPIGGNMIYSSGGGFVSPSGNKYKLPAVIQTYNEKVYDSSGINLDTNSQNWMANQGERQIGYSIKQSGKLIGSGDAIGSLNTNVVGSVSGKLIGATGGNKDRYVGGNWYGADREKAIGLNDGYNGGNMYGINFGSGAGIQGEGSFGASGGVSFGGNLKVNPNAKGNLYVRNPGNTGLSPFNVPSSGYGLWRKPLLQTRREGHLEDEADAEALSSNLDGNAAGPAVIQQRYSNKMKTKSGRPSESGNSEDY